MPLKKFCTLFIFIFYLCQAMPLEAIDVQAHNTDIRSFLSLLAKNEGINMIISPDISGSLSLHLSNVSISEIFDSLSKLKNLSFWQKNGILLVDGNKYSVDRASFFVFPLHYTDVEIAFQTAKTILYDENNTSNTPSRLSIDKSHNTLILYGTESEAQKIRTLFKNMDMPVKQVSLEAKIVALENNASKKLGATWQWSSNNPPRPDNIIFSQDGKMPFNFLTTLNLLLTEGKAKVLARPNIIASNQKEAIINIGGSVPIPTTSINNNTTTNSYEYHDTGIILKYTPRINDDNSLTACVSTEVISPYYVSDLKAYRFNKRAAHTTVSLKNGETMVIGGLINSEDAESWSKIPFLADIPLLGHFFRYSQKTHSKNEIIIFLTAHIIDKI